MRSRIFGHAHGAFVMTFSAILNLVTSEFSVIRDERDNPLRMKHSMANVVKLGFATFCLFTILLYGARLTAILVKQEVHHGGITTMERCVEEKCTVCVPEVMLETLKRTYGNRIRYYSSALSEDVFRDLNDDPAEFKCDVGVMVKRFYNAMWSSAEETKARLGSFVWNRSCSYIVYIALQCLTHSRP